VTDGREAVSSTFGVRHNDPVEQAVLDSGDGLKRCPWGLEPPEYRRYHDEEWGRPVIDDVRVFEKLCLEGFQSGLSWLTILRKRDGFRRAFFGFDIATVAAFDDRDVERLVGDAAIVRHRGKIEATVANARAALEVQASEGSLAALMWRYEPEPVAPARTLAKLPAFRPEAKDLSKELRRRGFRFVGPTTVYATMQALGVVNDHLEGCYCRKITEDERTTLTRPS
jgi:DNA-3-methyladenine glycosylase I